MPKTGFKSVTITEATYQIAQKQANQDATSVTEIISKAILSYIHKRLDLEDKTLTAIKAVQQVERSESGL